MRWAGRGRAGIAVFGLKAVWAEGAPRRQRPLKVEESAGAGVEDGDFSRPRLGRGANGDTGASITARAARVVRRRTWGYGGASHRSPLRRACQAPDLNPWTVARF